MKVYLKIKAKELGAEAKFNKQEQQKCLKKARKALAKGKDRVASYHRLQQHGMYEHLRDVVGPHARGTNIARGFLNGKEYKDIERWTYKPLIPFVTEDDTGKRKYDPNTWNYIYDMVIKYGEPNPRFNSSIEDRFHEWYNRAIIWVNTWQQMDEHFRKAFIREICPLNPKKQWTILEKEDARIVAAINKELLTT